MLTRFFCFAKETSRSTFAERGVPQDTTASHVFREARRLEARGETEGVSILDKVHYVMYIVVSQRYTENYELSD